MTLDELLALLPDNDSGQISAADMRTIITALYDHRHTLEDNWETVPRWVSTSGNGMASGQMLLSYLTIPAGGTINTVRYMAQVAGDANTLARVGLYREEPNYDLTLVASTPNDQTLFTPGGVHSVPITPQYFAPPGGRVAVAWLAVGGTLPWLAGTVTQLYVELAKPPRLSGCVNGQADLPASIPAAAIAVYPAIIHAALPEGAG